MLGRKDPLRVVLRQAEGFERGIKGDLDIRRASVTLVLERLDHSLLRRVADLGGRIPLVGQFIPEVQAKGRQFWELNNPEDVPRIEAMMAELVSSLAEIWDRLELRLAA